MRQRRAALGQRAVAVMLGVLLGGLPAYAAIADAGLPGYRIVAGDFNGDGWADLLFQALPDNHGEALFLSLENGALGQPVTWADHYRRMNWNASAHQLVVGDFNGDGRDDLLLQATPGLASGVMLTTDKGDFEKAPQGPITTIGGMDVSQGSHTLRVADFNGDGRDDLLLQANTTQQATALALAGPDGQFTALAASWPDDALGLEWSSDLAALTAGDFAGTGHAELLLRARNPQGASRCCTIVALTRRFRPVAKVQQWNGDWLGLDWSPADYRLIAADLNGDGRTDLLLQPVSPGGTVTVLLANAQGHFTAIAAQWPAEQDGRDWSSASYLLVPEPAAAAGKGGSLLMVPRQVGLPYVRVRFDAQGHPTKKTTLASPPMGFLTRGSGDANAEGGVLSAMAAKMAPQPHTGGYAVGALPGKFSVGAMGEARYRIPIAVAPGVNGMQPDLALSYDSRSGQTQLGLGWSLAGLSAISRCPATVATDGASRPVEMGASDDFCLDGAHLLAYPGQTYGADGTEYHTPTASFQKVISNGSQGSGPESFTVWGKDGLVREYGATTDSRLQGGTYYSDTAFVWLLDKITDRWGNVITFQYTKSQDVGENEDTSYQLSEIDYGNNAGTTVGKLVFSYQGITADHWSVAYMDGLTHIFKSLLLSITVESAGSTLWSYNFSYKTLDVGAPRLASVDECVAVNDCLAPTTFQYAAVSSGLGGLTAMTTDNDMSYRYLGDLDGDGRTDLIFPENGYWKYVTSAQRSTMDTGITVGPHPGQAVVFDANGDGYSDLLFPVSGGKAELAEWNPSAGNLEDSGQRLNFKDSGEPAPTAADVSGDGYPWVFFHYDNALWYIRNNAGTFVGSPVKSNYALVPDQQLTPIRFAHGAIGLYVGSQGCASGQPCANSEGVLTWNAAQQNFQLAPAAPEGGKLRFVDLNGDGLDDVVQWDKGSSGEFYVYMNEGGRFSSPQYWTPPSGTAPISDDWAVLDYTGDGRADLLWPSQDGTWHVISWMGFDGTESDIDKISTGITASSGEIYGFDYSGKAAGGVLENTGGKWQVRAHVDSAASSRGGALTAITDGLGASVSITYAALGWSGTQGSGSDFYNLTGASECDTCAAGATASTVRSLDGPIYVVRKISTSQAPGTTLTTNYSYYTARLDRTGRGFLGFAEIATSNNLGYATQTNYETAFPYTGMPIAVRAWGTSSDLLSVATDTLATVSAADVGTHAVFPYVKTAQTDDYDGGSAYKRITTVKSYDDWGNATAVNLTTEDPANPSGPQYTSDTASTYTNTASDWCLGRLTASTATHTGPHGGTLTRTSNFTYTSGATCSLASETFEPSVAAVSWTKTFAFDAFGNRKKVTESGNTFDTRTTSTDYDTNGRFPLSTSVAMTASATLTTTYQWNAEGEKTAVTGPNGDTVGTTYDGFGREAGTSGPYTNEASNTVYAWCGATGCSDSRSVYKTTTTTAGAPTLTTEFDAHGRKVFSSHNAYGGQTVLQAYYYDALGRQYAASEPYDAGTDPCWLWQKFDDQGRVVRAVSAANGSECSTTAAPSSATPPAGYSDSITTNYDGLTVTLNDNGRTSTKVYTLAGKLQSVTLPTGGPGGDETGGTTGYEYDALGDLLQQTDADGATTTYSYDAASQRTGMTSPASGGWSYTPDALGELTSQTDPTGNVITQSYDLAGNLKSRTLKDSAGHSRTSTWTYGTSASAYNDGRLTRVANGAGYTKSYSYNIEGAAKEIQITAGGTTYIVDKAYDGYGRMTTLTYPDSPPPPDQDQPPVAEAVASPTNLTSPGTVTLDGSGSHDPDHGPLPLTYQWTQTSGPTVSISSATSAVAQVTLSKNGTYKFKLTVGDGDKTDSATTATVTVSIPPGKPGQPSISPPSPSHSGNYTVTWGSVPNATGYDLDQSTNGGSSWTQPYSGTATDWSPASPKPNGSYEYKVRSYNGAGYSPWSPSVTEQVEIIPPTPGDLQAVPNPVYIGNAYTVSWDAVHPAPSYYLLQSDEGGTWHQVYQGSGLSKGFTAPTHINNLVDFIHYRVEACSSYGCSSPWANTTEKVKCPPNTCIPPAPAPATQSTWRFVVHYSYGALGNLTSVYGTDATSPYWELTAMDAAGHVTGAKRAGTQTVVTHLYDAATGRLTEVYAHTGATVIEEETYTYNVWGSRHTREDVLHDETETYSYDEDARVTGSSAQLANGNTVTTLSAHYDAADNLQSKSDAGGTLTYTYQDGHPNRLASLAVSGGNPGVAGGGVTYDAAGRITAGAGYTLSYDRRGLTATIARNGTTASLFYAPDGHRYEAQIAGSAGTTTVWYLAGGAFRVGQEPDGTLLYRQAIVAGGAVVGQLTTESTAASGFHYLYHDALGSTAALAGVAGTGAQALAYGPYGRRREAANWSSVLSASQLAALNLPTRRGYTGGESLDALGVVVLGARTYVPALARFLSPDPAGVGNPYGYVADDPLNDTDPTGALNWNSVGKIVEAAVVIVASVYTGIGVEALGGTGVEAGAAGGFVAGFAGSEGNLEDGAIGALGGAAMGYFGGITGGANPTEAQLFSRGVAEGLVGGTLSTVATHGANGSFASGFLGAFAAAEIGGNLEPNSTSWKTIALHTTAMAVVGGTAAELGGGSFANGAISAAFQQLFNEAEDARAKAEISFSYESKGLGKFAEAVKKYGLVKMFEKIFPKGHYTIDVSLDASLSGEDADMETPNSSTILVGPKALSWPINIRAAEIGHELVHVNDWLRGSLYPGIPAGVEAASEVRAYKWEFNAESLHLPLWYENYLSNQIVKYELMESPSTH